MGETPKLEDYPFEFSDFPYIVQQIIEIYHLLPAQYEGLAGSYLGKNFNLVPFLFDTYGIEDHKFALVLIKKLDSVETKIVNSKNKAESNLEKLSQNGKHRNQGVPGKGNI